MANVTGRATDACEQHVCVKERTRNALAARMSCNRVALGEGRETRCWLKFASDIIVVTRVGDNIEVAWEMY